MDTPPKTMKGIQILNPVVELKIPVTICEVHGPMPSPKGSCPACECDYHEKVATDLATMIRRGVWLARREIGDLGIKVWAGKAYQLLCKYDLQGNPLRNDAPLEP